MSLHKINTGAEFSKTLEDKTQEKDFISSQTVEKLFLNWQDYFKSQILIAKCHISEESTRG